MKHTCQTCAYWEKRIGEKGCDDDMKYCSELKYYISTNRTFIHTSSDFGCNKYTFNKKEN